MQGRAVMVGSKKQLTKLEMGLFAQFFAGLVLWMALFPTPVESFVFDDPVWVDAQP